MHEIAIIGAMDMEARIYIDQMTHVSEKREGHFLFREGDLCGRQVVAVCCGTGKVLAALTTQKVIDTYHPTAVIVSGVAGALRPELKIGDVVISDDCVQHDVDITALGFRRGVIPEMKAHSIRADRRLVSLAMTTPLERSRLVLGRIVTGDQFLTAEATKQRAYLFDELKGCAIDMESAAIALVCQRNDVPFVAARVICSEVEGDQEQHYRESLPLVANHAFQVIEAILSQWESFPHQS